MLWQLLRNYSHAIACLTGQLGSVCMSLDWLSKQVLPHLKTSLCHFRNFIIVSLLLCRCDNSNRVRFKCGYLTFHICRHFNAMSPVEIYTKALFIWSLHGTRNTLPSKLPWAWERQNYIHYITSVKRKCLYGKFSACLHVLGVTISYLHLYSKSSLTLNAWVEVQSELLLSANAVFLNSWRVSSRIVRYDTIALQLFENSNDTGQKLRLNLHSESVSVELLEYGR
jgi:hypothetical protein